MEYLCEKPNYESGSTLAVSDHFVIERADVRQLEY